MSDVAELEKKLREANEKLAAETEAREKAEAKAKKAGASGKRKAEATTDDGLDSVREALAGGEEQIEKWNNPDPDDAGDDAANEQSIVDAAEALADGMDDLKGAEGEMRLLLIERLRQVMSDLTTIADAFSEGKKKKKLEGFLKQLSGVN